MSGASRLRWGVVIGLAITMAVSPAGAQTSLPPGGTFFDDDGNIHEGAIEAIAAADITTGCAADLFCPTRAVTRAEMAAFLVRALGESPAGGTGSFSDVPGGLWFSGFVERVAQLGISTGYTDGTFRPNSPMSRGEMAVFLLRALDLTPSTPSFSDVPANAFFASAVGAIQAGGITSGCGNGRFCPFDQVLRDQMASFVSRGFDLAPIIPPPRATSLALTTVGSGFDSPIFVGSPPGDSRLFVVEQSGRIEIMGGGTYLDLSSLTNASGEQGLLGLAFHPSGDGRFYVNYTNNSGDTRIVEYRAADANRADPASARVLLSIDQPASNHNGGWLGFGPDGLLYIAMGDGGGGNDQFGNGQNPSSLLGKILRMNVDQASPGAEIWARGVRNPWRNAFDGDLLYVADVGQGDLEEVSVVNSTGAGPNLGWPIMEGDRCLDGGGCNQSGLTLPVAVYNHSQGCSITGGYVYRGSAISGLAGTYFYSDFCTGTLRSFRFSGSGISESKVWTGIGDMGSVSSFGVDNAGEIYVVTLDGRIRKIVPG